MQAVQHLDGQLPELWDEATTANFLKLSPGTLSVWRSTGRGKLPYIKVGRAVRYQVNEVKNWLEAHRRVSA